MSRQNVSLKTRQQFAPVSVAEAIANACAPCAIAKMLEDMGVQYAFGVSGGAIGSATAPFGRSAKPWAIAVHGARVLRPSGGFRIASLWQALQHTCIKVLHFRHEAGAAFAAAEAYFASGRSSGRSVYHNKSGDH
jgi:acetolactate synthase-1/2/3 large subunit